MLSSRDQDDEEDLPAPGIKRERGIKNEEGIKLEKDIKLENDVKRERDGDATSAGINAKVNSESQGVKVKLEALDE
jgi:hypothetical protein